MVSLKVDKNAKSFLAFSWLVSACLQLERIPSASWFRCKCINNTKCFRVFTWPVSACLPSGKYYEELRQYSSILSTGSAVATDCAFGYELRAILVNTFFEVRCRHVRCLWLRVRAVPVDTFSVQRFRDGWRFWPRTSNSTRRCFMRYSFRSSWRAWTRSRVAL